jgi:hypothetical protein
LNDGFGPVDLSVNMVGLFFCQLSLDFTQLFGVPVGFICVVYSFVPLSEHIGVFFLELTLIYGANSILDKL